MDSPSETSGLRYFSLGIISKFYNLQMLKHMLLLLKVYYYNAPLPIVKFSSSKDLAKIQALTFANCKIWK
jgi:hypothetical protein